jgi:hypothetical protein
MSMPSINPSTTTTIIISTSDRLPPRSRTMTTTSIMQRLPEEAGYLVYEA